MRMTPRSSPLRKFLLDALCNETYPNLFWHDVNSMIFCFKCVCKNKKEWEKDYGRVFEDYHSLKSRRTSNDCADKRQRLLVALKASSYVELIEEKSKDEKYYKLHLDRRSSADSCGEAVSPHSSEVNDSQVSENQDSASLTTKSETLLSEDSLLLSPQEDELLHFLLNDVDTKQLETDLKCTVNNLIVPDLESVQPSLSVDSLHLYDDSLALSSNCIYQPGYTPDFSDLCLDTSDCYIPNDYDPCKDFQLSQPVTHTANSSVVQNPIECSAEILKPTQNYTISVPEGDAMNFLMNQNIHLDASPKQYYLLVLPKPDSLNVSSAFPDAIGMQVSKPDSLNVYSALPVAYGVQNNYL